MSTVNLDFFEGTMLSSTFSFLFLQSNTIYFRNGKYQKKTGMVEDQIADGTAFCRCTEHDPGASSEYDLYKREVS